MRMCEQLRKSIPTRQHEAWEAITTRVGHIRFSMIDQNAVRQLDGMKVDRVFAGKAAWLRVFVRLIGAFRGSAEADGNRTRLTRMPGHTGFEDREGHQPPE